VSAVTSAVLSELDLRNPLRSEPIEFLVLAPSEAACDESSPCSFSAAARLEV
jgi:hypothetical protein